MLSAKSKKFTVIGWIVVQLFGVLLRVLSFFGSRWAKKKMAERSAKPSTGRRLRESVAQRVRS